MIKDRLNQRWAALAVCVFTVSAATACGASQEPTTLGAASAPAGSGAPVTANAIMDRHSAADVAFYESFRMESASSVFHYDTLAEGVRAADAVIIAEVVDVRPTRSIGAPDVRGDVVEMTGVVLRPVEVLTGSLRPEFQKELTVEFIGGRSAELEKVMPTGQAMWFLRYKLSPEPGVSVKPGGPPPPPGEGLYYRVIAPEGLFAQGPSSVVTPLTEDAEGEREDMASEGRSASTLSNLAATVRSIKPASR